MDGVEAAVGVADAAHGGLLACPRRTLPGPRTSRIGLVRCAARAGGQRSPDAGDGEAEGGEPSEEGATRVQLVVGHVRASSAGCLCPFYPRRVAAAVPGHGVLARQADDYRESGNGGQTHDFRLVVYSRLRRRRVMHLARIVVGVDLTNASTRAAAWAARAFAPEAQVVLLHC